MHCLLKLLDLTASANWRDAPRPGDSICKDIYSYLNGKLFGRSVSPLQKCTSMQCIWSELEDHLYRVGTMPVRRRRVLMVHGNGASSEERQEDDEQTWNQSKHSSMTEEASWKYSRDSLPSGSDTDRDSTDTGISFKKNEIGLQPTQFCMEPPELVRQRAFTRWGSETSTVFPDQTQEEHQYGLMGMRDSPLSSSMISMDGSPARSSFNSWIATRNKLQSKGDTLIGPRGESYSPATSIQDDGTIGSGSDTSQLFSDDSLGSYTTL